MLNWRALLVPSSLLLATAPSLTSCTASSIVNECAWVRVITVSPDDVLTAETARQILTLNRSVQRVCVPGHGETR